MCGFITLFKKQITEKDKINLEKGAEAISHRGPDDFKTYEDESVLFSFRRLSIIDIENGSQPYIFKNKYIIVFNGEIYNYIELRDELIHKGYSFITNSEIEVIGSLYNEYGYEFIEKLRGMFSICIYDKENNKILITRDRFGIKPLYYVQTEDGLCVSSELKAFMRMDNKFTYNKEEIDSYMTVQYVPEDKTLFNEIRSLSPGCFLEKKLEKEVKITRYSKIKLNPINHENKDNLKRTIYKSLEDSVKKHMISDVPVAIFLSSGIDSSITTYLAWKINKDITAYSIGFDIEGYDETPYAERFAKDFGINFKAIKLNHNDFIRDLPKIIYHMDTPIADPSIIPLYQICRSVSDRYKVVLSGEGSDEFFGGYNIYTEDNSLKVFDKIPRPLKKALFLGSKIIPNGVRGKSFIERGCTELKDRYVGNAKIFKENEKNKIINNYKVNNGLKDILKGYFREIEDLDNVCKRQYIDINTWLVGDILSKADRMSMANSLELRVPFLDNEVFQIASELNLDEKINGFTTKYMLREAFKDVLPSYVYEKKKLGYPVPLRVWLKNELYDWAKNIIENNPVKEINTKEALRLLEKHKHSKIDYSRKIWAIIVYILWYRIYIEKSLNHNQKFVL
ncbi:asparagine synthase (glutamine-hydrolyzing) [uncultured Clostridium sp.]|uniref:asparagine synthase (glutamine-hydrolyzing) n=1 Tax=uncultured Clostridium sp. TaxID=59620 RepID=UPI0026158A98|nr:asparagine synthase (glutamine-hydrolyzing) [uncultured Clostridium sp.]